MKDLALLVFRILLVAIFPISAYYKVIQWPGIANVVEKTGIPYAYQLAMLGTAAELILPFLIIFGIATRWAALGLILYVLAATYIGHPIWRVAPDVFFGQLMSFMKNLGMIGGLLLLVVFGPGRLALQPSRDDHLAAAA
jgi:putative oxidoreductase